MKELGKPESDSDVVNSQPRVLLIGYGWVGQFMGKYFTEGHYVTSEQVVRSVATNEAVEQNGHYDLAIIGTPTPQNTDTGRCDFSIVEEAVAKWAENVDVFLCKSTVEIGTCDMLSEKYGKPVCMSPEYVGETLGHKLTEPRKDAFQIVGGPKEAREKVADIFMKVLHADAYIHLVETKEAELIKYAENYWITRRVDYWNDIKSLVDALGLSFQNVRNGICLDPRMNRTHSNVYDDNRGWSGKCLPKDMNALAHFARVHNVPLTTLEQLIDKNADQWRKSYNNSQCLRPDNPAWVLEKAEKTRK